jgi:hypothetical protein
MSQGIMPENPTEGGRVYRHLSVGELQNRASDAPSGYQVAEAIRAQVESNLTDAALTQLANAEIDAFGFEVEVDAQAGNSAPFGSLNGAIGISLLWLTGVDDGGDPGPYVTLFADYSEDGAGTGGAEPIADAPNPAQTVEGSFFVAHFGDGSVSLDRSEFDRAMGTVGVDADDGGGGVLSGETTLYGADGSVFVWDDRDVWHTFAADLSLGVGGLSATIADSRYRHDEWLLGQLGFVGGLPGSSWSPPEHPFWQNGDTLVPEWGGDGGGGGGGGDPLADVAGLGEYGGAELYYEVTDADASREDHVKQLQADLWELGFWFRGMIGSGNYSFVPGSQSNLTTGNASGDFHAVTEWAVREFQIYAKRETVAQHTAGGNDRYVDNLEAVANDATYEGDVSGVLNEETAKRIQYWLENDWRCPVVMEKITDEDTVRTETHNAVSNGNETDYQNAFTDSSGNSRVVFQNVWQRLDLEHASNPTDDSVFVTDFSEYYGASATAVDVPAIDTGNLTRPAAYVVGHYERDTMANASSGYRETYGGPYADPDYDQTWPRTGEVLPENIVGTNVNLTPLETGGSGTDTLSTFKIVRASSELECEGYLDDVNSWDTAIVSIGPCHWTLALRAAGRNPSQEFGSWGYNQWRNEIKRPTQELYGQGGPASGHADDELREGELPAYISYLESSNQNAFDEAFGHFGVATDTAWGNNGSDLFNHGLRNYTDKLTLSYRGSGGNVSREPVHRRDGDYFRGWHWFSRFVMAGRTVDGYREGMWDMARFRIRDIRNTLWPPGVSHLPNDGGDPATIGDVVTSERGIALVLRWHIKSPAHVIDTGGNTLGDAVDSAWNGWNQDLSTNDWSGNSGDQHEADMVGDIATEMTNDGIGRIDVVRYWPHWTGWQTDPNHESRYRLFSATDLADGVTPDRSGSADDLLSEDRDSFDFDAPQSSTPTHVIQSSQAWLRDPNSGYAPVTGANPLHNNWNNLAYVNQGPNNTWEVDQGTPVTVTDRDSYTSGGNSVAIIEIEHASDGTRIGWTNMGNLY